MDANRETQDCPICYAVLSENKNKCITPCGHSYCMTCFINCTAYSTNCAVCRNQLYTMNDLVEDDANNGVEIDDEMADHIMMGGLTNSTEENETEIMNAFDRMHPDYGNTIECQTFTNAIRNEGITYEALTESLLYLLYVKNDSETRNTINNILGICNNVKQNVFVQRKENESMDAEDVNALYQPHDTTTYSRYNMHTLTSVAINFGDFPDEA